MTLKRARASWKSFSKCNAKHHSNTHTNTVDDLTFPGNVNNGMHAHKVWLIGSHPIMHPDCHRQLFISNNRNSLLFLYSWKHQSQQTTIPIYKLGFYFVDLYGARIFVLFLFCCCVEWKYKSRTIRFSWLFVLFFSQSFDSVVRFGPRPKFTSHNITLSVLHRLCDVGMRRSQWPLPERIRNQHSKICVFVSHNTRYEWKRQ